MNVCADTSSSVPQTCVVTVVPFREVRAHPKPGAEAQVLPLGVALGLAYPTDAHFAAYAPPIPRRLSSKSPASGIFPVMVALVLDVDCPEVHGTPEPAPEEWRQAEMAKLGELWKFAPGFCVYHTRGGYRIAYLLQHGFTIQSEQDAATWQRFVAAVIVSLRRTFDIHADKACVDWTRLFRLPRATRDGSAAPESWPVMGDPSNIGIWPFYNFDESTRQEAEPLVAKKYRSRPPSKKKATTTPEQVRRHDGEVGQRPPVHGVLFYALLARGALGQELEPGKFAICCPFGDGHSTGSGLDSSTAYFDPAEGKTFGTISCLHESCAQRTQADFKAAFSEGELRRARLARRAARQGKVAILLGPDEHRVVEEAVAALGQDEGLFQRAGLLVEVVRVCCAPEAASAPCAPQLRVVPAAKFREFLTRHAALFTAHGDEWREAPPPAWLSSALEQRGHWPGVRPIEAVVRVPVLRRDGSVLETPGYDPQTGLFLDPVTNFTRVPETPDRTCIDVALNSLGSVVADFPFEDGSARSGWHAFVLTLAAQYAYDGPTPIFTFDSNTPATGKGLALRVGTIIGTGQDIAPTAQPEDEAEERKLVTALAMSGVRLLFIDNVVRKIGSGVLEAVATTTTWRDRILGGNKIYDGPLKLVVAIAGNNLEVRSQDTVRRLLYIRLVSPLEDPEARSDFQFADLLGAVRQNLDALVWSALVLLRAYVVAGTPGMGLAPWGSFGAWSALIRNCLVWCGLPDPAQGRHKLSAVADADTAAVEQMLLGLEQLLVVTGKRAISVRQILDALVRDEDRQASDGAPAFAALCDAVSTLAGGRGLPTSRELGMVFRRYRDRVVAGRCLRRGSKVQGDATWTVESTKRGDLGGDRGCGSSPAETKDGRDG
jgi:hypothetical protein